MPYVQFNSEVSGQPRWHWSDAGSERTVCGYILEGRGVRVAGEAPLSGGCLSCRDLLLQPAAQPARPETGQPANSTSRLETGTNGTNERPRTRVWRSGDERACAPRGV